MIEPERHTVKVGQKFLVKSKNVRETYSKETGNFSWKFPVPMTATQNGETSAFDFVWLKVNGKCPYKHGDILELKAINSYSEHIAYNQNGGKIMYKTLNVEFEKVSR